MKKISLFFLMLFAAFGAFAQDRGVGCTIDSANTEFFSPRPDSLPCVERGTTYSQIIQILVPASIDLQQLFSQIPFPYILSIDSVIIDSVTGFPNGLTYYMTPYDGKLYGGNRGCALLYGTTNDPVGNYPLTFHGTMTMHGAPFPGVFDGDTTVDLAQIGAVSGSPFTAGLDVINPGDQCRPAAPSGINSFSSELNSLITVFPNPNNGVFNFNLNAGRRIAGQIMVVDVTGRKVLEQNIDALGLYQTVIDLKGAAKGIYTLKLQTAEGVATRNISIE